MLLDVHRDVITRSGDESKDVSRQGYCHEEDEMLIKSRGQPIRIRNPASHICENDIIRADVEQVME